MKATCSIRTIDPTTCTDCNRFSSCFSSCFSKSERLPKFHMEVLLGSKARAPEPIVLPALDLERLQRRRRVTDPHKDIPVALRRRT